MNGVELGDGTQPLDAILLNRRMMLEQQNPNLRLSDTVVLKSGPRAYKVATHWEVIDQHTGEFHHHSLKIETIRRSASVWELDEKNSITLEGEELPPLAGFLTSILHASIPDDSGQYLVVPLEQGGVRQVVDENIVDGLANLIDEEGVDIVSRLLNLVLSSDSTDQLVDKLESLDVDSLQRLNTVVGLSNLKAALVVWEENVDNAEEGFWQTFLFENAFVFSQLFSFPVIVLGGGVYVGGKGISNTGGNILDFLIGNQLTRNVALVEIKTPATRLVGSLYRSGGVYNVASDLSGAVIQVSNYRDSLLKEYDRLAGQSDEDFEVFNPQCMVIAGNIDKELTERAKRRSFELYRNGLKDVQVVTYDELFNKVRILVELLESGS